MLIIRKKIQIIPNAIDVEKFRYSKEKANKIKKELSINEDIYVFGHIGTFTYPKNHNFIIQQYSELCKKRKNCILLLVGEGPLKKQIENKVRALDIEDRVIFLGQRSDANRLYQAFDIFLLPSLYEGLPVVGVEAQASGLLCILSSAMTKETKVLNSTKFISLDNSSNEWANILLDSYKNYIRKDTTNEISNNGFNIKEEVMKLENEYIKNNEQE